MAGAIQPRINKAIINALTADETLLDLVRALPGAVADSLPLYWFRAPASAPRPYLVFGSQTRESEVTRTLCGSVESLYLRYEVALIVEGIVPGAGLAVVDRLYTLLSGLVATVDTVAVSLWPTGDFCEPDYSTLEVGVTHTGLIFQCRAGNV
jgi:hypothetical protein